LLSEKQTSESLFLFSSLPDLIVQSKMSRRRSYATPARRSNQGMKRSVSTWRSQSALLRLSDCLCRERKREISRRWWWVWRCLFIFLSLSLEFYLLGIPWLRAMTGIIELRNGAWNKELPTKNNNNALGSGVNSWDGSIGSTVYTHTPAGIYKRDINNEHSRQQRK
jgi:hypothetical protein